MKAIKSKNKMFSLFALAFVIISPIIMFLTTTFSSQTVYADWSSNTSAITQGDGSQGNPYVIDSAQKLAYMAVQCNNNVGNYQSAYYIQTTNIDISGDQWVPISSFSGTYDGQGYTINGLNCSSRDRFSFFDILETGSVIKNLGFTNVNISRSNNNQLDLATLANDCFGTVENCFAQGTIIAKISSGLFHDIKVAGLVKWNANGTIKNCYVNMNITATNRTASSGSTEVGGICQQMDSGLIQNCYSIGPLRTEYGYYKISGIIAQPNGGTASNCAVLRDTCVDKNLTSTDYHNNVFNLENGNISTNYPNTFVVSADDLKNMTASPLSSWEWNTSNAFPRTWGFVSDTGSSFYNNSYPQLRVFYENFAVNFYTEDGLTQLYSTSVRYPEYSVDFSSVSVPAKEGHTYNNSFSTASFGQGTKYTGTVTNIVSDMNLYVVYDVNIHHLTITSSYDLAGTVSLKDEDVAYGTSISAVVSNVNLGYRFVGWTNTETSTVVSTDLTYSFSMLDNDVSLQAVFTYETYFLKIVVNNNDYGSVTGAYDYYTVGQTVTLTAVANAGYQLDKIYLADGTILGTTETVNYVMPRENVTIYVDFVKKAYNVNVFVSPDATATVVGGGQYYAGDEVSLSFSDVSDGYAFACWKFDDPAKADGDFTQEIATFVMPTNDVNIYCCFISNSNAYVAFVGKDGKVIQDEEIALGEGVTPPANPELANYTFLGWYTAQVGGEKYTNFESISTNRLVLYAQYEKIFNCTLEISVKFLNNTQYKTELTSGLFFAMKSSGGALINGAYFNNQSYIIKLPEYGVYNFTFALPTYYEATVYFKGSLLSEKSFEIGREDESIKLEFVISNTNDYLLHDNTNSFVENTIESTYNVDPVVNVNGENVYVGVSEVVSSLEFDELSEEQIPVSPYGYELKDVIGATNWGGLYNFTELNYVSEGANFVANDMGSTVYKVSFANNYQAMYPYNADWGNTNINNMTDLAKTQTFQDLFAMENLKTFILVAYEFVYCPWERVVTSAYTLDDLEIYYEYVRQEFADLTEYLLKTYKDDEKIFILSNWEGDNAYGAYFDMCTTDEQRQLLTDAYVGYINARQDGIIEGRARVLVDSTSKVYGNFEVCHIGQDIPYVPNRWRLVDVAVPYTYCDLYSLSDWYSYLQDGDGNYTFALEDLLDTLYLAVQNNLCYTDPDNYQLNPDFVGKKNVMVTEFGYDENTDAQFYSKVQHEVNSAVEWGVYKLVYWGVYSNVNLSYGTDGQPLHDRPRNEDMQGLWLIRPDGTFTEAFWYFKSLIEGVDYITQSPKIIFNMEYVDTEGLAWEEYKDKIVFKDDLTDFSKMKAFSEGRVSLYDISTNSAYSTYFANYTQYFGTVDNSGLIQNQDDGELTYISYDVYSNRFAILLYNYTDIFSTYQKYDRSGLPIIIEGLTKENTWERIESINVNQQLDPTRPNDHYWFQSYISGTLPIDKYSELRISFVSKYDQQINSWDPIISSVIFFEGGEA